MWDDLMEKDPKMRKIRKESEAKGRTEGLKEGLKEGVEKGLKEGVEKGRAEALRSAVVTAVNVRFPDLTEVAQQTVAQIGKPEKLNLLMGQILKAPDEDAARLLLDLVAA